MRKVLITGSTSGFGKLLVDAFLANGDFVYASGRNLSARTDLFANERVKFADRFREVDLDVVNSQELERASEVIPELDILINNAGYGVFGALEDLHQDEIRHQMEVNFFGTVAVTKAFLPALRARKGKIFNFSSVFGFMGFPLTSMYCASKFAVEGFTESLRGELRPFGIQVCLIEPGGYRTNFGKNLRWSLNNPNSIYQLQMKNYQELHTLVTKKKPQEPVEVSEGLLKLSKRKKLPMRKVFGQDGKLSYLLRTFVPSCIYFPMMDIFYQKTFQKKN